MAMYYVGDLACDSNYLEHHGIKGQKWGVRRYQNLDRTWTEEGKRRYGGGEGSSKKLDKLYSREIKKFNKLKDRADVRKQTENAEKYSRRAKIGLSAQDMATATALGATGLPKHYAQTVRGKLKQYENPSEATRGLNKENKSAKNAGLDDKNWANTRKAIAAGGGAAAGVSFGYAVYNEIQAKLAKRRTTEIGHSKAVQKAKDQLTKMEKMFANTPYSELIKKQLKDLK